MNKQIYRLSQLVSKMAEARYLQGGTKNNHLKDWSLDYAEGLLEASRLLEDFSRALDKKEQLEDMEKLFVKHLAKLRAEQTDDGERQLEIEAKRFNMKVKRIGYFGQ
jgi:uncharacterized protein (DUF885 family)